MSNVKDEHYFRKAVFETPSPEELSKVYDEWAPTYDERSITGFNCYAEVAEIIENTRTKLEMGKDIRILDTAAGTGSGGEALRNLGFSNLDAQDASSGMLAIARKKCVYNNYFQSYLGKPNENNDLKGYDGVVCIGAFSANHLPADAFDDLVSFTKPDGFICFTIRDEIPEQEAYQNKMKQLVKTNSWKELEHARIVYYPKTGMMGSVFVYQKC